ncbi:MAG: SLBB domain-containing protein [Glaciecola sp.]
MKIFSRTILLCVLCCFAAFASSQSFVPSAQQIEQFKQLPKSEQQRLASQLGFDISMLDGNNASVETKRQRKNSAPDSVFNDDDVVDALAEQSNSREASAKLEVFGYDIFKNTDEVREQALNISVPADFVVGPGDKIKLQLFGKETGNFVLDVNNDGSINLPGLNPIDVAGTTFREIKQIIVQKYSEQKIGVQAFVSIAEVRTIQIFLAGEFLQPGPLLVNGLSTITNALINSGGISPIGSLRYISLKRNGTTVSSFDLYDLIAKGDTRADIRLEHGDVLFVPAAKHIVSIDGEVRRPAIFEVKEKETIGELLMLAGGTLPSADTTGIQIIRKSASGLSVISVDGNDSKSLAQTLSNGDYVKVPKGIFELNNAVLINGAINLPIVIPHNNKRLSDIVTPQSLLLQTDLNYALLLRKQRLKKITNIIQFRPSDVINKQFDLALETNDEIYFFTNHLDYEIEQDTTIEDVSASKEELEKSDLAMLKLPDEKDIESESQNNGDESIDSLKQMFKLEAKEMYSRSGLLKPILNRLKNESSNNNPSGLIQVSGEVKFPGIYPLAANATLSNILDAAGGLTEAAFLEKVEITRMSTNLGEAGIEHINLNLYDELIAAENNKFKIQSKDVINIVKIPKLFDNAEIELKGEVVFPGKYQIKEGEMLSSVIQRAGGLTNRATIGAAIFTRLELQEKERSNIQTAIDDLRQNLANNNISSNQFAKTIDYDNASKVLDDLTNITPVGRMVIDLASIMDGSTGADLQLKDGDRLIVPNITPAVSVIGEVFVSTTYRYQPELTINDYISRAGGAKEHGDMSKIYVVKANGAVFIPRSDFWFSGDVEAVVEPGDTIIVPRHVTNYEDITLWQGVTQIAYQAAVAIAAIGSL